MKDTVLITGGGTGGHIMPAIALAREIMKENRYRTVFVGRSGSMEERLALEYGLEYERVASAPRGKGLGILKNALKNLKGLLQSLALVRRAKPKAVIGFGGYSCAPLLLASLLLKRRTIIHDSNSVPGKVTRILARYGALVALGLDSDHPLMQELKKSCSPKLTGNPLREEFFGAKKPIKDLLKDCDPEVPLMLVFGGSQGARNVNRLIVRALPLALEKGAKIQVVHISGEDNLKEVREAYAGLGVKSWVFPFYKDMPSLMAGASFCISRSGAMSVSEIEAMRLPSILVPLPCAADNHQFYNARHLEALGAAVMAEEKSATPESLAQTVFELASDRKRLEKMAAACRPEQAELAAKKLARLMDNE